MGLQHVQGMIDGCLKEEPEEAMHAHAQSLDVHELLHIPHLPQSRQQRHYQTLKEIMAEIDGTTSNPIDLTDSQSRKAKLKPLEKLNKVSLKFLKFAEDVRPPYIGTYTRLTSRHSMVKLARNPVRRGLPDTNYDYDSEAEWEEPVEGEDLDSEGDEEEDDEEEGNEMEGFLDDEDATTAKRRPLMGNMEPISTGICWDGPDGSMPDIDIPDLDRRLLRLDALLGEIPARTLFTHD